MNKKAIEMSLQALIGIVLGIVVVFATYGLATGLYNILTGKPNQGTGESFNNLNSVISIMKDEYSYPVQYYIQDGFVLLGFDGGKNSIEESCWKDSSPQKPIECRRNPDDMSKACLCIVRDNYKNPVECRVLDSIKIIHADFEGNFGKNNNLAIYGKCERRTWQVKQLYLTKYDELLNITDKALEEIKMPGEDD